MRKILLTAAIAASLAITSVAVYAASSIGKNESTQVPPKAKAEVSPQLKKVSMGTVAYTKEKMLRSDGSLLMVNESWVDTNTFERREDSNFRANDKSLQRYSSLYLKDNCRTMIDITRDASGKPVSGTITPYSDRAAKYNHSLYPQYNSFSAIKAEYTKGDWKAEGTIKSEDGKILKELYKTNKITMKEAKPLKKGERPLLKSTNSKEVAYIDEITGFPVKREFYIEKDGVMILEHTRIYEFKMVQYDDKIFDTSGVSLKKMPLVDFDPTQGVG